MSDTPELKIRDGKGYYTAQGEQHQIDGSKIKTLEDVIALLTAIQWTVWDDGDERFEPIRHLYEDEDTKEVP